MRVWMKRREVSIGVRRGGVGRVEEGGVGG